MKQARDKPKQRRRQLILAALNDQLLSPETPEVKRHYERLRTFGHNDAETGELMATILAFYLWHAARKDDYTYNDYLAELSNLPEIDLKANDTSSDDERA